MEIVFINKSEITRIAYKSDVDIYYTKTRFFICEKSTAVDLGDRWQLKLATKPNSEVPYGI